MLNNSRHFGTTKDTQILQCNRCLIFKLRSDYHKRSLATNGLRSRCKQCISEVNKEPKNLKHRTEYTKSWFGRPENGHKKREYRCRFYSKPGKLSAKIASQNERAKIRKKEDPNFLLSCSLRTRFTEAIKNGSKAGSAVRDLGCSIEFLKTRIQSQFKEGMSWNNYGNRKGQWNIDHKAPLSWFDLTDPAHIGLACHYLNLRPMWASENVIKGDKIDWSLAGWCRA